MKPTGKYHRNDSQLKKLFKNIFRHRFIEYMTENNFFRKKILSNAKYNF